TGGRALELGCGPGRNALYLAAHGFDVDAVDLSPTALAWARERAEDAGRTSRLRFHHGDVFTLTGVRPAGPGSEAAALTGPYDLVYDSGCFHHLPPHRRITYLTLLDRVLAPGGRFALTCFAAGGMGSELPDAAFYTGDGLRGGLAYTDTSLRHIFSGLTEVELLRMREEPEGAPVFGKDFVWAGLFRRADGRRAAACRPLPGPEGRVGHRLACEDPADRRGEVVHRAVLDEETGRTGVQGAAQVAGAAGRGEDEDPAVGDLAAQLGGGGPAGAVRQVEVEQDHVRAVDQRRVRDPGARAHLGHDLDVRFHAEQ